MRLRTRVEKKAIAGAYVSSLVSMSLVLVLVGLASMLVANTRSVADYFKESLQMSVLFRQEVKEDKAEAFCETLRALPYVKNVQFISREQGTLELKEMLGEDFLDVFETSPVPASADVALKAEYVSADSLAVIIPKLEAYREVEEVSCQHSLVEALNANLGKITLVLCVLIGLLVFISFVLISNMVRISIFNHRFTIHTMRLVGATRSFICRPFLWGAALQGGIAALVATAVLGGGISVMKSKFPTLLEVLDPEATALSVALVFLSGILICVLSTLLNVSRLVKMSKDELYY